MATITPNTTASGAADLTPEIEYDCLVAWSRSVFGANQHDTVHPMYLTAFKSGYKAALAASAPAPQPAAHQGDGVPTWQAAQDPMLECSIQPRPLSHPLSAYHSAMSKGPLHYTWQDKPHRLVYDLIAAVKHYANQAGQAAPAPVPVPVPSGLRVERGFRWDDKALHHIPNLLVEFEPVPALSPNDMKGWKDRDAIAAMLTTPQPAINPRTQYLTVVYRGVEAGDEARVICDHPKVSAVSWSHALDDRDAALAAAPKAAPAPVSKSFDEWLEKQFEFRNYYFDLRGPGLMAIPFARRAYEAGRAPVAPAPQPAPMPCPTDAQIDAVYEQTMGQHLRSQDAPAVRRFGRAMFLCAWNAAAPKAAPAINKVSDIIDAYGMTPGQPERVADIPGLAEALEAAFADGSAQVTGAAPPHQGEYLPPPKPDTHCHDEDTGMDVWSYSASQVHAAIDADRAARGAAQVAPAPVADGAVKALHDAMADCRTNGISIDASVMGFFCNRLNEQPAPVAEDADPLQDAANWLVTSRATTSATELGSRLCIGYNRADRLFNAARAQAAQPEGATP